MSSPKINAFITQQACIPVGYVLTATVLPLDVSTGDVSVGRPPPDRDPQQRPPLDTRCQYRGVSGGKTPPDRNSPPTNTPN